MFLNGSFKNLDTLTHLTKQKRYFKKSSYTSFIQYFYFGWVHKNVFRFSYTIDSFVDIAII